VGQQQAAEEGSCSGLHAVEKYKVFSGQENLRDKWKRSKWFSWAIRNDSSLDRQQATGKRRADLLELNHQSQLAATSLVTPGSRFFVRPRGSAVGNRNVLSGKGST
jgi:hypothetical protein